MDDIIYEDYTKELSVVGSISKKRGDALESFLRDDINRLLLGFPGWKLVKANVLNDSQREMISINGSIPDVDMVLLSPNTTPCMILSSKSSVCDNSAYASIWHINVYAEKNIQYKVITKDDKGIFKTGNTKYLNFLNDVTRCFYISNDIINAKDKNVIHDFIGYNFNEKVRPYHELISDIAEFIQNSQNLESDFFDFI